VSATHPKIARRARMQWDAPESRWMLLYPERGLALNETAALVVKLCDGSRSVDEIIASLAAQSKDRGSVAEIDRDVRQFLARLTEKNLIE
jgi:coenzyme PQQ biosynthesis protein PqqD